MQVGLVVAYWACMRVVMGLNPGYFFYASAMLFYIMQRITILKFCILKNLLSYISL
jgi:hypothetical protein